MALRKNGASIRDVEKKLGVARSTLSGWFKGIKLTKKQERQLQQARNQSLIKARRKAVLWHNAQRVSRENEAKVRAREVLGKVDFDKETAKLALAMLYLGEGSKSLTTCMGNSDPLILKYFIASLVTLYCMNLSKIKCELHLRFDQDPTETRKYWAKQLRLPIQNFTSVSSDKRSKGRATYKNYRGVCVVRCGRVDIQRELVYLSRDFCDLLVSKVDARLAQLVEHVFDVDGVVGSSPTPRTK
jgi:hypothetical protein